MAPDKRNPLGIGDERAAEYQALGGADVQQNSQNVLSLQVSRLRRRFILSESLAAAVAELAFSNPRRAAA